MSNRKIFHDSVTELPPQAGLVGRLMVKAAEPAHLNETMPLRFALQVPAAAENELARLVE